MRYFDFLDKNGIEKKDINAANLDTQPEYDYPKTGETVLKGYRAARQVQVTVRQVGKLNELLDGALKFGLNEIRAIKLGVANPYFTHGKIIRNVYQLSKVVSPEQTIRQIATYTVGPLTKKIDEATGWGNTNINLLGYKIPCSFTTLGTLATETLAITTSPAQWAVSKTVNLISNSFTSKVITKFNLQNQGALGREAAAAIQIGSSLICQKTLEEVEKNEIVASNYKKIDKKLKNISKPIDNFVYKQISNGLEKLGIDTTQPLGLTKTDIEREKNLLTSEEKVVNIEEKIQELKKTRKQITRENCSARQNSRSKSS